MKRLDRIRDPYGEAERITQDERRALLELALTARAHKAARADIALHNDRAITHYLLVLKMPVLPWWLALVIKKGGERGWDTSAMVLRPLDLWQRQLEKKREARAAPPEVSR